METGSYSSVVQWSHKLLKVASICVDTFYDPYDHETQNPTQHCGCTDAYCNTDNSPK